MKKIYAMSLAAIVFASCSKKKDGESLGAPNLQPPLTRNLPEGFTSGTTLNLSDAAADKRTNFINAAKDYLSAAEGPSASYRLKMIDSRMAELEKRALDSKRDCASNAVVDHTQPGTLPHDATFALKFNCQETLNDTSGMAFGKDADTFYLMERTGETGIAVLAQGKLDGTGTDVWEITKNSDGEVGFTQISAHDDKGTEVTLMGATGSTWSLGCGLHFKSNSTHAYISGTININGTCDESFTVCLDAKTLTEVSSSQCDALKTFELTTITRAMADAKKAEATKWIDTKITGYTDFNQ